MSRFSIRKLAHNKWLSHRLPAIALAHNIKPQYIQQSVRLPAMLSNLAHFHWNGLAQVRHRPYIVCDSIEVRWTTIQSDSISGTGYSIPNECVSCSCPLACILAIICVLDYYVTIFGLEIISISDVYFFHCDPAPSLPFSDRFLQSTILFGYRCIRHSFVNLTKTIKPSNGMQQWFPYPILFAVWNEHLLRLSVVFVCFPCATLVIRLFGRYWFP